MLILALLAFTATATPIHHTTVHHLPLRHHATAHHHATAPESEPLACDTDTDTDTDAAAADTQATVLNVERAVLLPLLVLLFMIIVSAQIRIHDK